MANTKFFRTGALLLLLLAAVLIKVFYAPSYEGTGEPFDRIEGTFVEQVHVRRPNVWDPPDTSSTHGIDRELWSAPPSNWRTNEGNAAKAKLRGLRPTVMILPVQGDNNAFDPVERSLMARIVSERVALGDDNTVLPPGLVLQYLGVHRSRYSDSAVKQLAKISFSTSILVMHAQHDRNGSWELRASLVDDQLAPLKAERIWSDLDYSDEEPPSVALEELLDEVVEYATDESIGKSQKKYKFSASNFVFPDSVADLADRSGASPLHAAAYLQLLAALHPWGQFDERRDQLFERSLVELQHVSPRSPYYRYFKARAYFYLDRRPAALASLAKPENEHEAALLEYLNGNLPALRRHVSDTGLSALDFMAWGDLIYLANRYDDAQGHEFIDRFSSAHPIWATFIERSIQVYDTWAAYSTASVKIGLEDLLPIPDVSLRDSMAKVLVTGDSLGELELTRLVWRHVDAVRAAAEPDFKSKDIASYNESVNDVLDLAKAIAVANHIDKVLDDLDTRDVQESALAKISEFEPLFSGHPAITLLKGRAQREMAEDRHGSEKETLTRVSIDTLLNGFAWTGTINHEAAAVAREYSDLLALSSHEGPRAIPGNYLSRYSRRFFEWPKGRSWYTTISGSEGMNGGFEQCSAYSPTAFNCVKFEIAKLQRNAADPDAVRDEILAANAHRFAGNPQRAAYEIEISRATGSTDSELATLKAQINAGNANWNVFKMLGQFHKIRGEYEEAARVWMSYPGFQPGTSDDRLAISHDASVVGSQLFWIGQYELAAQFLNIAANQSTGSGGEMSAAQRIALIDGDLDAAEYWAAERVRRYNNMHGLRDLLQILHIRDQSEFAWSIFDQFQATAQNSQMWSGALIGHRKESATIADIVAWVNSSETRRTAIANPLNKNSVDLGPRYILMAGTMDRVPDPELAKLVADAHSRRKPQYMHQPEMASKAGEPKALRAIVFGSRGPIRHDDRIPSPRDERRVGSTEAVSHRYTMIAPAITAFLNSDYEVAYEQFNEAAYYYMLDDYLPYHAFSAAVLGRTEHISAALAARESALEATRTKPGMDGGALGYRFDEDLAYAVLSAFDDDHQLALENLKKALNNRPYINDRSVYPMYQIVDLADRLYEHTGEELYREFALELSRRHTVVLPMYAWAYYVVAKYSPAMDERIGAAASGLKLDPLSHRGKSLPEEVRTKALELLDKGGAPYLARSATPQNEAT